MSVHPRRRRRRRKERRRAGERAPVRRGRKTDQSLRLFSIKLAHGWQGEICATVTAGRGPVGDWSAQIGRGRDKRQLVTRVSCTCDGGRLFWATLAGIPARGVHVGSTGPSVSRFRPPVCFESCRCPETYAPPGNWRIVGFSLAPPGSTCRFGLSDQVLGARSAVPWVRGDSCYLVPIMLVMVAVVVRPEGEATVGSKAAVSWQGEGQSRKDRGQVRLSVWQLRAISVSSLRH